MPSCFGTDQRIHMGSLVLTFLPYIKADSALTLGGKQLSASSCTQPHVVTLSNQSLTKSICTYQMQETPAMLLFFLLLLDKTCFCVLVASSVTTCIRVIAVKTMCTPCLALLLELVLCPGSTDSGVMMEEVSCAWLPSKVVTVQNFTPVC